MEEAIVSIDMILKAIIGPPSKFLDEIIVKAKKGELRLIILDFALFCALYSVKEGDNINIKRFAELLKYAQIETSEYLGPEDRESWKPSKEEVTRWRKVALQKD